RYFKNTIFSHSHSPELFLHFQGGGGGVASEYSSGRGLHGRTDHLGSRALPEGPMRCPWYLS
ncbi:unnamed protein product, partial [Staurois parvus]